MAVGLELHLSILIENFGDFAGLSALAFGLPLSAPGVALVRLARDGAFVKADGAVVRIDFGLPDFLAW